MASAPPTSTARATSLDEGESAEPVADAQESTKEADSAREVPIATARVETGKRGGALVSFRAAYAGVARTIATQRNMKLHMLSGLMVLIVGMALPLDLSSRVVLLFAVAVVFFAEILNTGLEAIVDLFIGEYHRLAMLAKDAAAGGVLVFSVATVLVFGEILYRKWELVTGNIDAVGLSVVVGVPLVISEAVGLFVLRRGFLASIRLVISIGLVVTLAFNAEDPIYAGLSIALVLLAAHARANFPQEPGRGAPPKDVDQTMDK